MAFNTLDFLLLFFATVVLYYLLPHKTRNVLLLFASYVFYAAYNLPLTLFLVLCTLVTYFIAVRMERQKDKIRKKRWAVAGIVLNVGTLAFYKYTNFFLSTVTGIAGIKAVKFDLVVPLGISFIVFQVVSYLIDVYRETICAEKNLLKFSLYVAFFPKLVQGPIERAGDIIPQFDEPHVFNEMEFREGMLLFLYGFFMKMVVADRAAIVVNTIFSNVSEYRGAAVAMACVLFAFQIYCDFAGYSYTAIGAAKILGFKLKRNFRQPYLSLSVGEFWRRWHISLNNWLRDYLYIPLGGSRCSKLRCDFNTFVTFGISGLWHGADWGYVIWGLLNAFYINVGKRIRGLSKKASAGSSDAHKEPEGKSFKAFIVRQLKRVMTFILITFSWIFFRAQSLSVAKDAIARIVGHFEFIPFLKYVAGRVLKGAGHSIYGVDAVYGFVVLAISILIVIVIDILADRRDVLKRLVNGKRVFRWFVYYFLIFAVLIFGIYGYGYSAGAFIYAGF